jgi:hypothetical protein
MSWWTSAIGWLNSVPAVIWSGALGAVLAAGISYFGVRSANASSLERLRVQHENDAQEAIKQREHDAKQKEEDRKAAIRREVYTKAVEEVHAVLAAIGGFPLKPLDSTGSSDAEPLQAFLKANAKVWLVAEAEAAHLSRELASLMSELYMKARSSAYPLRVALEPVREINEKLVHADREVQRINLKIAELNEQRAELPHREAAGKSWSEANEWVEVLKAERQRVLVTTNPQRQAHAQAMFKDMAAVQQTIVKLVSSLRKELHLPPNEAEFLAQHADMEKRALAALNLSFEA